MKTNVLTELFLIEQYKLFDIVKERKVEPAQNISNNNQAKKDSYNNNNNKGKNYYGKKRRYYTDYC
tara:strand:+ start:747 stop:944 length:198 start_codon:yes stop_codon:yes gene_type:complete